MLSRPMMYSLWNVEHLWLTEQTNAKQTNDVLIMKTLNRCDSLSRQMLSRPMMYSLWNVESLLTHWADKCSADQWCTHYETLNICDSLSRQMLSRPMMYSLWNVKPLWLTEQTNAQQTNDVFIMKRWIFMTHWADKCSADQWCTHYETLNICDSLSRQMLSRPMMYSLWNVKPLWLIEQTNAKQTNDVLIMKRWTFVTHWADKCSADQWCTHYETLNLCDSLSRQMLSRPMMYSLWNVEPLWLIEQTNAQQTNDVLIMKRWTFVTHWADKCSADQFTASDFYYDIFYLLPMV